MGMRPLAYLGADLLQPYLWHLPLKYLAPEKMGWLDRGHAIQTPLALLAVFAASVVWRSLPTRLIERPAASPEAPACSPTGHRRATGAGAKQTG